MTDVRIKVKAVSLYPVNTLSRKGVRMKKVLYDKGWHLTVKGKDKENALKSLVNFPVEDITESGFFYTVKNLFGRIGLIAASIAVSLLLTLYSFCTLNIEIKGIKNLSEDYILENISEYTFVPSFNVKTDTKAMEKKLMTLKGISSASVKKVGTTLKIEVLEELPPTSPEDILWSSNPLVSKYDAIITKVVPRYGTVLVKENDTVRKGQELIAPYRLIDENGGKIITKAGGEIYGRVWLKKSRVFSDYTLTYKRTGQKKVLTEIRGFEKLKKITPPYKNYETETKTFYLGGALLPLKAMEITFYETKKIMEPYDFENDREALIAQMTRELEEEIPLSAKKLRSWGTVKRLDNATELVIYYEIEINIIN